MRDTIRPSACPWPTRATLVALALSFAAPATAGSPWRLGERTHRPAVLAADLARLQALPGVPERPVWVTFVDRGLPSAAATQAALAAVDATLGERARARRTQLGALELSAADLPVHAAYVARVQAMGARLRVESRWLNAVSVNADPATLERLASAPFVARLLPVASGRRGPEPELVQAGESGAAGAGDLSYGASLGQLAEIQVTDAHAAGYSGQGVVICMIDTGYYKDHETFAPIITSGRLLGEQDFINGDGNTQNEPGDDPNQHNHGTLTWSACGGATSGELYGPGYGAMFLLAKTEDVTDEQPIEEDYFIAALEWADQMGADITSSSLSYRDWYTPLDMDGATAPITIACDIAASRNILCVTSAGNQGGDPSWRIVAAPADADSVVAIGAMDEFGAVAGFSSQGPTADGRIKPEVCARGVGTACALPIDPTAYGAANGTSLSCPLVAGAAALVMEAQPTWTAMQVREALMMTADNAASPDTLQGWGRIRVVEAIAYVPTGVAVTAAPSVPGWLAALRPNPVRAGAEIDLVLERAGGAFVATLFDVQGRRVRTLFDRQLSGGRQALAWEPVDAAGRRLAPGVYFMELTLGQGRHVRKVVVER